MQELIVPSGLTAVAVNNKQSVQLSWTVVDIDSVDYFVVEHYNRHTKGWEPFDGLHGIVEPDMSASGHTPTQSQVVDIGTDPGQQSFRVKSVSSGKESDWVATSIFIDYVEDEEELVGNSWVNSGLLVTVGAGLSVNVASGTVYINDVLRQVSSTNIPLPGLNQTYLICISKKLDIFYSLSASTPPNCIRLAEVTVDEYGNITVKDTRFLWPPGNFEVKVSLADYSTRVSWIPLNEINLKGYNVYRSHGSSPMQLLATIDNPDCNFYEDATGTPGAKYLYQICSIDHGDHESPKSSAIAINAGDVTSPSAPSNVAVSVAYIDGVLTATVTWDHCTEALDPTSDFSHYRVYLGTSVPIGLPYHGSTEENFYEFNDLSRNQLYYVAISSVDENGNISSQTDPVPFELIDNTVPKAPVWADPPYYTRGAVGQDASITLRFLPVTQNTNETEIQDFAWYNIYRVTDEDEYKQIGQVTFNDDVIEYTSAGRIGGVTYRFAVTAVDRTYNESEYSDILTVVAGDTGVPKAPVIKSLVAQHPPEVPDSVVVLSWDQVTQNTDDTPCLDISHYRILRGLQSTLMLEIAVVEYDDTGNYTFTDETITYSKTYYYALEAVDTSGNVSATSQAVSVSAKDNRTPASATITDIESLMQEDDLADTTIEFSCEDESLVKEYWIEGRTSGAWMLIGVIPVTDPKVFTQQDLEYGDKWSYRIYTVSYTGNKSGYSTIATKVAGSDTPLPVMGEVTATPMCSLEPASALVYLEWDEVEGASSYKVYRSTNLVTFEFVDTVTELEFTDGLLENGWTYIYMVVPVTSYDADGTPYVTDPVTAGDTAPPSDVSDLTASIDFGESCSVTLEWDEATDDESAVAYYNVYRKPSVGPYFKVAQTQELSYTNSGVSYGKQYTYKVTAVDTFGNESDGVEKQVSIVDLEAPPPVTISTVQQALQPDNTYAVTITWLYNTVPDDFYMYEIKGGIKEQESLAATITNKDVKSFTDRGLIPGCTYRYIITVYDKWYNASTPAYTQDIVVADTTIPKTPTNFTATPGIEKVTLSFDIVTENTDGSTITDLDVYEVQGSTTQTFSNPITLKGVWPPIIHSTSDDSSWYYRVRAVDKYGTPSAWSTTIGPYTSLSGSLDTSPPSDPEDITVTTGFEQSEVDGSVNAYADIEWDHDGLGGALAHFYVYLNGVSHGIAKETSYRANKLVPGMQYTVEVEAESVLGARSSKILGPTFTAQSDNQPLSFPEGFAAGCKLVTGAGVIHVVWPDVSDDIRDIRYYELQARSTPSDHEDWTAWDTIYRDSGSTYPHGTEDDGKLSPYRRYAYRIRIFDMAGNCTPDYVYFNPQAGLAPSQVGDDDIAADGIFGRHFAAQIVDARVIKAHVIETDHIKPYGIDAHVAHIRNITAEELNISAGGRNIIKNSAFSMVDKDDGSILNWTLGDASVITDNTVPVEDITKVLEISAGETVTQTIPIGDILGQKVTLSAYISLPEDADVSITLHTIDIGGDNYLTVQKSGPCSWIRESESSEDYISLSTTSATLEITCASGTARVTCLDLEPGDLPTPWVPHPSEVYSALGSVQINTSGLLVKYGNIRIETANAAVVLNSEGLIASKTGGGSAKLSNRGLTIVNGAVEILTGATSCEGMVINGTGLLAYNNGKATVRITTNGLLDVSDGQFRFTTADSGNRLELDHLGLRGYNEDGNKTVDLDTDGKLRLLNGFFEILSGSTLATTNAFQILGTGLSAYDASGRTAYIGSDGTVEFKGPKFTLKNSHSNEGIEFDKDSLRGLDSSGNTTWEITSGKATFGGGTITITTSDSDNAIVINTDPAEGEIGISGPGFKLAEEDSWLEGLSISNGSITMDDQGMVVDGLAGIVLGTRVNPLVSINSLGILLSGAGGLKVGSGGTIKVGNSTAIDEYGVRADTIYAGTLNVGDGTSKAKIVVDDKIVIDDSGISITDGALNVIGSDGQTLIQNGLISANAIIIGSNANTLYNGRADFGTEYWQTTGTCTLTADSNKGFSGNSSFKISASANNSGIYQTAEFIDGEAYTLSARIYLESGSATVSTNNASQYDNAPTQQSISTTGSWQLVTVRFIANSSTSQVRVLCTNGTVAYVTDICLIPGVGIPGFYPHPTELKTSNVSINERGITILNGSFRMWSQASGVTIDESGIASDNGAFTLNIDGMSLNYGDIGLTFNKTVGLRVQNGGEFVEIKSGKILVRGAGGIDYQVEDGTGATVEIKNGHIGAYSGEDEYAQLDTSGIHVVGDGMFSIKSSSSSTAARMELATSSLKFFESNKLNPSIFMGLESGIPRIKLRGYNATTPVFEIESDSNKMYISDMEILAGDKNTENPASKFTKIDKDGVTVQNGKFFVNSKHAGGSEILVGYNEDAAETLLSIIGRDTPNDESGIEAYSGVAIRKEGIYKINIRKRTSDGAEESRNETALSAFHIEQIGPIGYKDPNPSSTNPYKLRINFKTPFTDVPKIALGIAGLSTYKVSSSQTDMGYEVDYNLVQDGGKYTGMDIVVWDSAASQIERSMGADRIAYLTSGYPVPDIAPYITAQGATKVTGKVVVTSGGTWVSGGLCIRAKVAYREHSIGSWHTVNSTTVGGGNWGALSDVMNVNFLLPGDPSKTYDVKVSAEILHGNGNGSVSAQGFKDYVNQAMSTYDTVYISGIAIG